MKRDAERRLVSRESLWTAVSVALVPVVAALLWRPDLWLGALLTSIGMSAIVLGAFWAADTSRALDEIRAELRKVTTDADDNTSA